MRAAALVCAAVLLAVAAHAQFAAAPIDFLQTNFNLSTTSYWQLCALSATSSATLTVAEVLARCGGSRLMIGCYTGTTVAPVMAAANKSIVIGGGVVNNTLAPGSVTWTYNASLLSAGTNAPSSCLLAGDGICFPISGGVFDTGAYCGPLGWVPSTPSVTRVFYTNACEGIAVNGTCPSTIGACGLTPSCNTDGACISVRKPAVPDTCVDTYNCDAITGDTSATTYLAPGSFCQYNNSCVASAECAVNHTCLPASYNPCIPTDSCHGLGTCNLTTETCEFPNQPDGTTCGPSSLCHGLQFCVSGNCTFNTTAPTAQTCGIPTVCSDITGWNYAAAPNGTGCASTNMCLFDYFCDGSAVGQSACTGTPATCEQLECRGPPTCNTVTGQCEAVQLPAGTPCDDGNPCVQGTSCNLVALCTGGTAAIDCEAVHGAPPECYEYALTALNSTTCVCTLRPLNDTSCDDGDLCTDDDTCHIGVCSGTAVTCPGDDCNAATSCSPTSRCYNPYPDSPAISCNSTCVLFGICLNGTCGNGVFNIANPSCVPGAAGTLFSALAEYVHWLPDAIAAKMFGGASTAISAVGLEGAASTAARALARTLPIGIGDGEGPDTHVPAA